MCLAVPGRIVEIVDDANDIARVELAGVRRDVNIALVRPDGGSVGDWVLVHVGFALSLIDEGEAEATLRLLSSLSEPEDDDPDPSGERSAGDG